MNLRRQEVVKIVDTSRSPPASMDNYCLRSGSDKSPQCRTDNIDSVQCGAVHGVEPYCQKKSRIGRRESLSAVEIEYASDIKTALSEEGPDTGRSVLWGLVILFTLAIVWASQAGIEEVTTGNGRVIPSSQTQIIQSLDGGILSEIMVREGDVVEKGQILLRIDDTRYSSTYKESLTNLTALKAKQARLSAEAKGSPLDVADIDDSPLLQLEKELYNARQNELKNRLGILTNQSNQHLHELTELKSSLANLRNSYRIINRELEILRPLFKAGAVSEIEVLQLEKEANTTKGEMESTRLTIPRIELAYAESLKKVEEARFEFQNQARKELNEVEAKISALSEASVGLEDRVNRTLIRSPVKGTINQILISTIGGVVQPGKDLIEIVPIEDSLLIEARIKPTDIAFLHPGQNAVVKFTAYDFSVYGGLPGRLEHISADSIADPNGESFYLVRVRTEKAYLGNDQNQLPIIPGMLSYVDILTGERTILEYILKPILKAKEKALRER